MTVAGVATAAEELERIYQRDGHLTPATVVAEAKSPKSPLHSHFTWDDSEAAHQWRLQQGRVLIASIKIEVETQPDIVQRVRRFTHLGDEGYVGTPEALNNPMQRHLVFDQALRELESFRRKYEALIDVEQVWVAASKRKPRSRTA